MMKIGIAGGIGSGKSYVCQHLRQRGYDVYDCDSAAKRLIRTSPEIREQLTRLVGPDAYTDEGQLNKAVISRFLLASADNQKAINDIVHPAVFHDFEESGMQWMESAILYESGADKLVDRVVVVTAPEEVRIERIMKRDGITREKALQWIARQWPQELVRERADVEIVNDGKAELAPQIDELLKALSK